MKHSWIHDRPTPTPSVGEHTAEHLCPYCQYSIIGTRAAMEHILECCDRWRRGYRLTPEPGWWQEGTQVTPLHSPSTPIRIDTDEAVFTAERRERFPNLSVDE